MDPTQISSTEELLTKYGPAGAVGATLLGLLLYGGRDGIKAVWVDIIKPWFDDRREIRKAKAALDLERLRAEIAAMEAHQATDKATLEIVSEIRALLINSELPIRQSGEMASLASGSWRAAGEEEG